MARVVARPQLTIQPQGDLRRGVLASLLGRLGLVSATGLLELRRKDLVRRFVLDRGRIQLCLSNALDDRLLDWLVAHDRLRPDGAADLTALMQAAEGQPLTGALLAAQGALPIEEILNALREQLREQLEECEGWKSAGYSITPGRADLGLEPVAELAAVDLALELAAKGRRRISLPEAAQARATAEELAGHGRLDSETLALLDRLERPTRCSDLPPQCRPLLELLLAADLVAAVDMPVEPVSQGPAAEVGEPELQRWLAAAESEDLAGVLGIGPAASEEDARRAYYLAVRRFHPDRFRSGPLAGYHSRVEAAFVLAQRALEVFTSSEARRAWENRHKQRAGPDPVRLGRERAHQAQRAARQGRRGDAVSMLEQAVNYDPAEPKHRLWLALLLLGNPRRRPEAIASLETLCEQQPANAAVHAALALGLERAGERARARELVQRARAMDPKDPAARAVAGDPEARSKLREDPFFGPLLRRGSG